MAFIEDVIDWITSEVTHIGLSEDGASEYSGGDYAALAPTYGSAASGSVYLSAALVFDGVANDGPITHYVLKRRSELWRFVALGSPVAFNSDGRLDLTSAKINASVVAG